MEARELIQILWRRRPIVIAGVLCATLAGAAYAYSRPKRYEADATLAFLPETRHGLVLAPESLAALLATYATIAHGTETVTAAQAALGHPLRGTISTSTSAGSWTMLVSSEADEPEAAAQTAGAVTEALSAEIRRAGLLTPQIVQPAVASAIPISTHRTLLLLAAALAGLLASAGLAVSLENVRRTRAPAATAQAERARVQPGAHTA
jgi:uncharacterized protein involved in exopolysaccharide biosynthesis